MNLDKDKLVSGGFTVAVGGIGLGIALATLLGDIDLSSTTKLAFVSLGFALAPLLTVVGIALAVLGSAITEASPPTTSPPTGFGGRTLDSDKE